jgi:DNA-binding CsgD family transcriptional regulator
MALFDRLKQMRHAEGKIKDGDGQVKQNLVSLLTPREADLYHLLLEGYTLKESAKALSVKYSTANTHMTALYKKLKVNTRAELIIKYRGICSN